MFTLHYRKGQKHGRNGSVAIGLLLIALALSVAVGSYLSLSMGTQRISSRAKAFQQARVLAHSAIDSAKAQIAEVIQLRELGLSSGPLQDQLDSVVEAPDFPTAVDRFQVNIFSLDVQGGGEFIATNLNGKLVEYQDVLITVGVEDLVSGARSAMQDQVRIVREPFLRYAIFFSELLELHPGPAMTVNGDMRSNSNIELWCNQSLKVTGHVKCPGNIILRKSDQADSWTTEARRITASKKVQFLDGDGDFEPMYQDGRALDSREADWESRSEEVWDGRVEANDLVVELNPAIGDDMENHVLIEPKDTGDTVRIQKQKLANKADLYIQVKEDGDVWVTKDWGIPAKIKKSKYAKLSGTKDYHGVYDVKNSGWIRRHENYYDPRESEAAFENGPSSSRLQRMRMVDVYLDKMLESYPDTSVVYVEVEEPSNGSLKPAVRFRNGYDLSNASSRGLTVATHRMAYVEGEYNSKSELPALIAADNLTVLSNGWDDNNSASLKPGGVSDTSIQAAVMTGYNDPENLPGKPGTTFTGGAHNLIRYRENWKGMNYNFKGSYLSLWHAQDSHCLISGSTYSPPRRNIQYDTLFLTQEPPGMPVGYAAPESVLWKEISWDEAENL